MRQACSLRNWLTGALLAATTSCFTSDLKLENDTTRTLRPYLVVTDPPPPHRQGYPMKDIAPTESMFIDTDGFNPVFQRTYRAG